MPTRWLAKSINGATRAWRRAADVLAYGSGCGSACCPAVYDWAVCVLNCTSPPTTTSYEVGTKPDGATVTVGGLTIVLRTTDANQWVRYQSSNYYYYVKYAAVDELDPSCPTVSLSSCPSCSSGGSGSCSSVLGFLKYDLSLGTFNDQAYRIFFNNSSGRCAFIGFARARNVMNWGGYIGSVVAAPACSGGTWQMKIGYVSAGSFVTTYCVSGALGVDGSIVEPSFAQNPVTGGLWPVDQFGDECSVNNPSAFCCDEDHPCVTSITCTDLKPLPQFSQLVNVGFNQPGRSTTYFGSTVTDTSYAVYASTAGMPELRFRLYTSRA
jgi:hypothetical protein